MAKIIRWNPMREMMDLRTEFDRLFDSALDLPTFSTPVSAWGVALDVTEDADKFTVVAAAPGMEVEDFEITVNNNVLTIQGEYRDESEEETKQYHVRERRFGKFTRSVSLPATVEANKIGASYDKGLLTIHVPKAEVAKPKRIEVKVGSNGQQVLEG
jgi:HSP20 family protein